MALCFPVGELARKYKLSKFVTPCCPKVGLADVMQALNKDQEKRATAQALLYHTWLQAQSIRASGPSDRTQ